MGTKTVAQFLAMSLFLTIAAGCGSKPATTPQAGGTANSANPNSSSAPNAPASNSATPATAPAAAPALAPAPPPPLPVVIPAGTTITVTLDQTVNSQTANNGDPFAASLAVPLTSGSLVVLPVGTKVGGTVVTAQSAGKFKGNALLQLVIDSVRINGTRYPMQTNEFEDVGKGRGKRTAVGRAWGSSVWRNCGRSGGRWEGRCHWSSSRRGRRHRRCGVHRQEGHRVAGRNAVALQARSIAYHSGSHAFSGFGSGHELNVVIKRES